MRIGNTMIDTDSMTSDELRIVIDELRRIKKRKDLIQSFTDSMNELIGSAKEQGFEFVMFPCGCPFTKNCFTIYDERG